MKIFRTYVSKPSFSAAKNPRTLTRTNWGKVRGLGRELGIRNNTRQYCAATLQLGTCWQLPPLPRSYAAVWDSQKSPWTDCTCIQPASLCDWQTVSQHCLGSFWSLLIILCFVHLHPLKSFEIFVLLCLHSVSPFNSCRHPFVVFSQSVHSSEQETDCGIADFSRTKLLFFFLQTFRGILFTFM